MKSVRSMAWAAGLVAAVAGFGLTGCNGGSGDGTADAGAGGGNNGGGNNGGETSGGGKLAGRLFGGGSSGGGANNGSGAPDDGQGGGPGGEIPGGGGEIPGGGDGGGTASQAQCAVACTVILNCFSIACDLQIGQSDLAEALTECTTECQSEASAEEVGQVDQLGADNCAQFVALAEEEDLCSDIGEDDFTDPDPGSGSGGSGGSGGGTPPAAGQCATFCTKLVQCCGGDPECDDIPQDQCVQACDSGLIPAPAVSCVNRNINQSCDAIEGSCAEFFDDEGGGEDPGNGEIPGGTGSCDMEVFCDFLTCAQSCGDDEACGQECSTECASNPAACQCDPASAASCFQ